MIVTYLEYASVVLAVFLVALMLVWVALGGVDFKSKNTRRSEKVSEDYEYKAADIIERYKKEKKEAETT